MGAQIVRILPQLLWLALVAFVIYALRTEARALLQAIVKLIPKLERITVFGVIALQTRVLEARIDALEANKDQAAYADMPKKPENGAPVQPTAKLRELSDLYEKANKKTPRDARVRLKNELAAQMADEVRKSGVSRETLATGRDVGLGVALAASVVAAGEQSDLKNLRRLLPLNGWPPHARSRLINAITAAIQRQQTFTPENVEAVNGLLNDIERTPEANLPRRVKNVRELFASRLEEPSAESPA
jgi:hypothetical protein